MRSGFWGFKRASAIKSLQPAGQELSSSELKANTEGLWQGVDKLAGDKMSAQCQLTVRDKAAHYRVPTPTEEAFISRSFIIQGNGACDMCIKAWCCQPECSSHPLFSHQWCLCHHLHLVICNPLEFSVKMTKESRESWEALRRVW